MKQEKKIHIKKNDLTGLEIAVIGMSGRLPGARTLDEFWNNLTNGVESVVLLSDDELRECGINAEVLNDPSYVKAGAFVDDIEYFDASFFDYTPREVEMMDPQIRIFHECVWEALENAGYDPFQYKGTIGLYAGAAPNLYWKNLSLLSNLSKKVSLDYFTTALYNDKDFLSTRISYKLDLKGPSLTLSTASSTSLVAIHLACQGLLNCECNMAIAGGISISLPKKYGYFYQEGLIFSPDGHCRSFDMGSQGTVLGNGAGVVMLKPLEDAIADRDHIRAIIKGSAINNDGHSKVGYTAPGSIGQAMVIRAAHRVAEIESESISYVETHGIGTQLGDPIEIEALKLAFNTDKKRSCQIGSVKPNIGHLYIAAGVAGFIKTVLALEHKEIPPTINFDTPNPKIDFENSPFYVNTQLSKWTNAKYPLRAGVSSFGIGGTNAHVVLEEAPDMQSYPEHRPWKIIILSAKTKPALEKVTENLVNHFRKHPETNLADAAYTLQVGRKVLEYRRMMVCSNVQELINSLSPIDPRKVVTGFTEQDISKVVFMFPGQGSQYVNMGLKLYEKEPVFREEMDRCFTILEPFVESDLKEMLYPSSFQKEKFDDKINQTAVTQPLLFIFEYAFAKLLMKWGIKPWAMIGHSLGEYVAACLAGVFSLEDALLLVTSRWKLIEELPAGAMSSVAISVEELRPFLLSHELSLASVNSSSCCVVSGSHEAIATFETQIKTQGYGSRRLLTSHAFHSAMMEPIIKKFGKIIQQVPLNKPTIPYISNVSGTWVTPEETTSPDYWMKHLRHTVRFSEGLQELLKETKLILMEVGPGKALSTFALQHTHKKVDHTVLTLVKPPKDSGDPLYYLFNKIGHVWILGEKINWSEFHTGRRHHRIPLPSYPFERQQFNIPILDLTTLQTKRNISQLSPDSSEIRTLSVREKFDATYVAPRNKREQQIVDIFQEFLGIQHISIHENFFEMGGDSVGAPKILAIICEKLNVEISLQEFFSHPTVEALAMEIEKKIRSEGSHRGKFCPKKEVMLSD